MSEASPQVIKLLKDAGRLLKAREIVYRVSGKKFNIFRVLNIEEKERFICRVLEELLSPSGSHYQGSLFLKAFVKKIPKLKIPDTELENARVSREYTTSQGKRIDIAIKTPNYFVAIEVKINAKDSDNQCRDYYEEAKRNCADENNARIVYLTPDGREPSEASACREEICVSFQKEVHEWLSSCLNFEEIEYAVSVREIIRQLLMTIESFTGQAKGEYDMEIKDLIASSPENLRMVFELQSVVRAVVDDKRKEFLKAVDEKLKSQNITYGTFEDAQGKDLPRWFALQYKYDKMPNVVVCLGFNKTETFVSYCIMSDAKTKPEKFIEKLEASRGRDYDEGPYDKTYWQYFYWEYCYVNGNRSPNFAVENSKNEEKEATEATFELFDSEAFNSFVDVCAEKIRAFLEFSPE